MTYQKDTLNLSNPHLNKDLTSIIQFVETHLEPEIKIECIYFDGSDLSDEELEVKYEGRMTYKNKDELINFLLTEQ